MVEQTSDILGPTVKPPIHHCPLVRYTCGLTTGGAVGLANTGGVSAGAGVPAGLDPHPKEARKKIETLGCPR